MSILPTCFKTLCSPKLIVNSGELDWYETPDTPDGVISLWSNEVVNPHTYLFNVLDDPEERTNVADAYPHIVDRLIERIAHYRKVRLSKQPDNTLQSMTKPP